MAEYRTAKVTKGRGGWGGPLTITPEGKRKYVASVTGGGIHPVAEKIAEVTGAEAVDGFKGGVKFDEMACAVIDCGGTARIGVYPMKGVLTVDVHGTTPAGPLAMHIKEENFVSGVGPGDVEPA